MAISKKPVLVLDLDGTLVDTKADLVAALNHAITGIDLDPIGFAQIGEYAGKGARAMITRALEIHKVPIDEGILDPLFDRFLDYYTAHTAEHSRPFPGAIDALTRFANEGWLLAVCTNKFENLSRILLGELDMASRFSAICGSDTFEMRKPDGRHILKTIEMSGGDPQTSVMVGDTPTDFNAAQDANIYCIAVDFGFRDNPRDLFMANRTITHFDELWSAVTDR